ncbi:biotin synthase [Rodentibacter pneumotropicus]|uniref:Biotin synthase n=1 Tax=Rodentibacter pneumotropicus TaxID=758 RepID=A0A448MRR2_9PAST|nr:biotin synthase [Rodentibacter pneumotropicus]
MIYRAAQVHRENFNPQAIQLSTLMSIKTGGCPEDCGYCPQSARYQTGVQNQQLLDVDEVITKAKIAKSRGAGRFVWGPHGGGQKPRIWKKSRKLLRQ